MTSKELREAAELYLSGEGTSRQRFEAFEKMADYILANVQEDGELPLDEAWLREEWGFKKPGTVAVRLKTHGLEVVWDGGLSFCTNAYQMCVYTERLDITTRSQFRALMVGLGIDKVSK